jgi:transglutaminase-like putative cysteine protease
MSSVLLANSTVEAAIEQHIRYDYSKPVTNLRQRLVVVPPARHGRQYRGTWSLDVRGARATIVEARRDTFGNVRIQVVVPRVRSWVEFDVRTTVTFRDDQSLAPVRRDPRFLKHTMLTAPDDAIALLLTGSDRRDPEFICAEVHRSLTYEYGITDVDTTAAEALSGRRGVCQDYAHLMVAACRLVGMPARYVSGHLLGEGGSHAWVEVLREHPTHPDAWVAEAWDPTHCRRTNDNYITIATGRDYRDVAPMSGTFDGSAVGALTVRKHASARTQLAAMEELAPDRLAE